MFIGTGQVLVLGGTSAQLVVTPGTPTRCSRKSSIRGIGPDVNVTPFVTGGELGGVLDFNREMLAPARSELGRIAVGLVTTVNAVHRDGMDAEGRARRRFLLDRRAAVVLRRRQHGAASLAVTIDGVAALEPTSYRLTFDGTCLHRCSAPTTAPSCR